MIITQDEINKIIFQLSQYPIKTALDLGCGKGRISMRLAEKGIKVLGIDIKEGNLKHENFRFSKENVNNFGFNEKFDLVICSLLLHFLRKEEAVTLIKKIQLSTLPKGLNLFICLSDKDDLYKQKSLNFYPSLKSLKEIYCEWEILKEMQDVTEIEDHDNLGNHQHNLIILLLRKRV
jgi:cyclopropane fatty-acyl-phospholipid synthase-like methyltransferase